MAKIIEEIRKRYYDSIKKFEVDVDALFPTGKEMICFHGSANGYPVVIEERGCYTRSPFEIKVRNVNTGNWKIVSCSTLKDHPHE